MLQEDTTKVSRASSFVLAFNWTKRVLAFKLALL